VSTQAASNQVDQSNLACQSTRAHTAVIAEHAQDLYSSLPSQSEQAEPYPGCLLSSATSPCQQGLLAYSHGDNGTKHTHAPPHCLTRSLTVCPHTVSVLHCSWQWQAKPCCKLCQAWLVLTGSAQHSSHTCSKDDANTPGQHTQFLMSHSPQQPIYSVLIERRHAMINQRSCVVKHEIEAQLLEPLWGATTTKGCPAAANERSTAAVDVSQLPPASCRL
jgi:hypothetical protein